VTPTDVIAVIPGPSGSGDPGRVTTVHAPPPPTRRLSLPFTTGDRRPVNAARVMGRACYPVRRHAEALAQVEALGLGEEAEAGLLRETARKVFKL